jgi:hypothetical protein
VRTVNGSRYLTARRALSAEIVDDIFLLLVRA